MKTITFLLVLVFLLPASSFAVQGTENTCNQRMADAVTHVEVEQGAPSHSVVTPDGCWIFVSVSRSQAGTQIANPGIAVLRRDRGKIEPRHFFQIPTTGENLAVIENGRILAVPTVRELVFLDVDKLTSGAANSVISRVGDHRFLIGNSVTMSADGHWLFALQYDTLWMSVIDITGLSSPTGARIVGGLTTGASPRRTGLSPDGKYLYLPSSVGSDASWPEVCEGTPNNPGKHRDGSIQVIDVKRAVSDPSTSVVATIRAGCATRRVAVSPDGRTLYATAGDVLAFDVQPLERGLPPTEKGKVPAGEWPVGIVAVDGGRKLIVANTPVGTVEEKRGRKESLTVIDASKISTGSGAVLGTVPVGSDPRNITVTPDGRTLLVNNSLGTLDVFDIERLPLRAATQATIQQASSSNTCNQPAADPITDFKIDGIPRFALPSLDGCWVFLRVDNFIQNNTATSGVAVLRRDGRALKYARYLPIPGVHDTMSFTPNQKMLIVKADRQIAVLDVDALKSGSGQSIRGYINDAHFTNTGGPQTGPMPVSRDGKYLFVSQHSLAWISIIDLQKVEAGVFGAGAVAGGFPTEPFPSGITISPDDKYLFITTGGPPASVDSTLRCRDYDSRSVTDPVVIPVSALSIVDISRAISNSESTLVAAIGTGCSTASSAISPDGKTMYMAAHGDNNLLAFDLRPALDGRKPPILIGTAPVGSLPRDLVAVDSGKKVIVANSNQLFGTARDTETLTVIDATKIQSGIGAVLGTIRVGADPRYLSVTSDGRTLFVSNFKSRTLQMIDLDRLPLDPQKP